MWYFIYMSELFSQEFVDALGSPEEWSKIADKTVMSTNVEHDNTSRKIVGSVATIEEVQATLDSLEQD
jgi:hypothetical protein